MISFQGRDLGQDAALASVWRTDVVIYQGSPF